MTSRTIASLLVGAILLSGAAVASAQGQDRGASVAALEKRRAEVVRQHTRGRKLTASDYRQMSQQRARVQELIDRLEAGQSVTPQEMDRALALPR